MACEPIPNCGDCDSTSEALTCDKLKELRCKYLAQLDMISCMPNGPIELEGVKFESRSAVLKQLREMIEWTYKMCADIEGPGLEYSSAEQCSGRCDWWGSSR